MPSVRRFAGTTSGSGVSLCRAARCLNSWTRRRACTCITVPMLGEFRMASDTVVPSFRKERRISHILEQIPEAIVSFNAIGYTIGGMMLFPGNQVDRRMTINAARGCHPRIKDRFDLTVECIRRYYLEEESPLSATLARYSDFFRLFGDFRGYVEFFLLQDLVTPKTSRQCVSSRRSRSSNPGRCRRPCPRTWSTASVQSASSTNATSACSRVPARVRVSNETPNKHGG